MLESFLTMLDKDNLVANFDFLATDQRTDLLENR